MTSIVAKKEEISKKFCILDTVFIHAIRELFLVVFSLVYKSRGFSRLEHCAHIGRFKRRSFALLFLVSKKTLSPQCGSSGRVSLQDVFQCLSEKEDPNFPGQWPFA